MFYVGGIPYIATSATVVYLARQAGLSAAGKQLPHCLSSQSKSTVNLGYYTGIDPGVALTILDQALNIQVTYGAVMLSFLGNLIFCISPHVSRQFLSPKSSTATSICS